jgi:cobalt-zinc-cadmium resistance protein CzcA
MFGMRSLGVEFLPHLEEGNMYIRASLPASISLEGGQPTVNAIRKVIATYPEAESVLSAQGVLMMAPMPPASSTPNSSCR